MDGILDGVVGRIFFFKQKTAYEIKECDWSSDVCSSDLLRPHVTRVGVTHLACLLPLLLLRVRFLMMKVHHQIGRASCRERV